MDIFNTFGSILGYLLWFLYTVFNNYGVAIIIFSVVIKVVMFPLSVKQQKSMAAQSKLSAKQKELQAKYGKNKVKYNEELQKLYDKEGVSPGAGCITGLIPLPIMLGLFYSVINPLSNTLHIAKESIAQATSFISRIPGVTAIGTYPELTVIRNFDAIKGYIVDFFTPAEMEKMESFSKGFNFLGLDLLSTPQNSGFMTFMWVIPLLSLVASFLMQFYMTKNQQNPQAQQPGCMKATMYLLPLMSVWWAWIMPGAVGFYSVTSAILGFAQSYVTNNFFSIHHMTAMSEAQRDLTLQTNEAKIPLLSPAEQRQIAERIEQSAQQQSQQGRDNKNKSSSKKSSKKKGNGSNSDRYMGNKK